MIKVLGSPWLAFSALGIKPETPERHVQATVYLAQLLGIDLGYSFALLGAHPTSLDLSVDFADWREGESDSNVLAEVAKRFQPAFDRLVAGHDGEWLMVLASVHYIATHCGVSPNALRLQSIEWDSKDLAAAEAKLQSEALFKPAGRSEAIEAFPAALLMSDEAKARKLLNEAAALLENLGFEVACHVQPRSEETDVATAPRPNLAAVRSGGPAAAA